jgi:N-methylhydantoinase B
VDYRNGARYVSYETIKGGFGARPTKDGINGMSSGISNTMNTPIEILEMSFPVRVERYAVIPDSGGVGKYRAAAAWSACGASSGLPAQISVLHGAQRGPALRAGGRRSRRGSRVTLILRRPRAAAQYQGHAHRACRRAVVMHAPGSGGYGVAGERDPAQAREDSVNGYVTGGDAVSACPACI